MVKTIVMSMILIGGLLLAPALAQTVTSSEDQMIEPVVINGEHVQGVTFVQSGKVLKPSCPSPQPYRAADHSDGWACFDETSGNWLLHAVSPEPTFNGFYGYPNYPYPYYPYNYGYGYPFGFFGGPAFGFGFGHGHDHNHFHGDDHFHGGSHFEHEQHEHGHGGHFEGHEGHGDHGGHGDDGKHN